MPSGILCKIIVIIDNMPTQYKELLLLGMILFIPNVIPNPKIKKNKDINKLNDDI